MHNYPKFSSQDYVLPNQADWQGRTDTGETAARFFQIVQCESLESFKKSKPSTHKPVVTLLGFACDEGVRRNQGRVGAAMAPHMLRQALANFPLHDKALSLDLIDLGDITCPNGHLEQSQHYLSESVKSILARKAFPIILGGGHETAWGHYCGFKEKVLSKNIAIINFDAHFDMRPTLPGDLGSSGTSFLQIANDLKASQSAFNYFCIGIKQSSNTQALFNAAKKWNVKYLTCDEIYAAPATANQFIDNIIASHDVLYVSVCLDVFSSAYAPGVSAASPYGLAPWQVLPLLRRLGSSKKVIALDIVELAPPFDHNNLTAKLGAQCIAEFLYFYESFNLA